MSTFWCHNCEEMRAASQCSECGEQTEAVDMNPREKGDDDGMEYGHPGDRLAGRD